MMGLGSILARRHLYDLFKLAKLYSIDAVSFLTRQEWHSVLAFADSAQLNDDVMRSRVENYVELAMEDEEIWEVGEDECDDEEARKDLERFRQNERRLTKAMSAASNAREEIASLIAGKLLDKRVMERHLLDASDATIAILTDLSVRERETGTDDCYYSLDLSREQCYPADALERWGYAIVHDTKPWENEDEHRHVTGIDISGDVLALFREAYTTELDQCRRNRSAVFACCDLAKSYYETAPIGIVLEIYRRYADAMSIPELPGEQDFAQMAVEVANGFYAVLDYEGETYVVDSIVADDLEGEDAPYESILSCDLEKIQEWNHDFYIPPREEILEYTSSGYWPSREPYQKLEEWLTAFYLDEKEIENRFPRMMAQLYGEEETGFHQRYSLDDVEENVHDQITLVAWLFMSDNDVEDVLDQLEDITVKVRTEALEELTGILEECRDETNKACYLGHKGEKGNVK